MKITINQIKIALLANVLVIGLAACSSTPAPWNRPDASPWQGKSNASSTAATDDSVSDATEASTPAPEALPAGDSVAAAPAPAPAPAEATPPPPPPSEAAPMQPEAAAAPAVPAAPAPAPQNVAPLSNEARIMALSGDYYAVQAYAALTLDGVNSFKSKHHLDNMMAVKTARGSKTYYVLVETFPTRAAANAAAKDVKKAIGSNPWIRSVAGLKKVVKQ